MQNLKQERVTENFPVEYCRAGFVSASATFDPNALDVDLSGKSFMITGANTGIGKATTTAIAKRGGTVHMLCLDPDEETRREIAEKNKNENVYLHVLDLSQSARVYQFAKEFANNHNTLHALINCAAANMNTRKLTEDGLEMTFAVNTLAPYLLTKTLMPLLSKTSGSRVIMVSSSAIYYYPKLDVSDLQSERMDPFVGMACYSRSKRQLIIMTEIWARAFPTIHFAAMHPGVVETPLLRSTMAEFFQSGKPSIFRTPEQGADTIIWLSISKQAALQANGQFYLDRKAVPTHLPHGTTRCSEEERQKVMESLEEIAADIRGRAE